MEIEVTARRTRHASSLVTLSTANVEGLTSLPRVFEGFFTEESTFTPAAGTDKTTGARNNYCR